MIYSFLYVFVFSIALVLIQYLDVSIPPLFSLLVSAVVATIYFNIININSLKTVYKECTSNKLFWANIMLVVLVMWASTMVGPGQIGASVFNFLYFAWLGILGSFSLYIKEKRKSNLYLSLSILTLLITAIFFEISQFQSLKVLFGVILSLVGGSASFAYFKISQNFRSKTKLSATQILAVRFYLSIVALYIFLPKKEITLYFSISNLIIISILAFLSLIIPLYFSQKALEKITSEQHAIINSLCPIVTGGLEWVIFRDITSAQVIIFSLYSLSIACFYFINKINSKKLMMA